MSDLILQQRNLAYYNVKDYGATGNGITDDTNAISAARSAANAAGGGTVFYPAGTYLTGNQTVYSYVHETGAGVGVTTIKLKNGSNTDLFSAYTSNINLAGTNGSGPTTGAMFFGFHNLTLDGNKANQTSGPSYPLRVYGYGHILEHVEVRSGYSGGILMDWYGGANPTAPNDAFMPHWYDVMTHDCNGLLYEVGGPTDMQWMEISGFAGTSHGMHIAPNCIALRQFNTHLWATPTGVSAVTLLCEAAELQLTSCQIEGSDTCALVVLANDFQAVGLEVGSTGDASRTGRGIQLGQTAGKTPYTGQIFQSAGVTTTQGANLCLFSGKVYACNTGALDEENTSGCFYQLVAYQTAGTGLYANSGYPTSGNSGLFRVSGLTQDGTPGKGGYFQIANGSYYGFKILDKNNSPMFSVDTYDSVFQVVNGRSFSGYSDNGSTQQYSLDATHGNATFKGNVALGQTTSATAITSVYTITTANVGVARVAPTGNVTGIILQSGTTGGQTVCVVNESAFTVTFDVSGTSHVADGTSAVIAAQRTMFFVWDSGTSLWYHS